jgi:hypothetical protein
VARYLYHVLTETINSFNVKTLKLIPTRVYPKVSGLSHKEIYAYNNKPSLRSSTKDYGGVTY